jgi:hypothetical protein
MVAAVLGGVWPDVVTEDQDYDVFDSIGSFEQRQPAQRMGEQSEGHSGGSCSAGCGP